MNIQNNNRQAFLDYSWINDNNEHETSDAITSFDSMSKRELFTSENQNIAKWDSKVLNPLSNTPSVSSIIITNWIQPNDEIVIKSGVLDITLKAMVLPINNHDFITSSAPVNPTNLLRYYSDVIQSIISALRSTVSFTRNYTVSSQGGTNILTIRAVSNDELYDLNVYNSAGSSNAFTIYNVNSVPKYVYQTVSNPNTGSNYKFFNSVYVISDRDERFGDVVNKGKGEFSNYNEYKDIQDGVSLDFSSSLSKYCSSILPHRVDNVNNVVYFMDLGYSTDGLSYNGIHHMDMFGKYKRILVAGYIEYGDSIRFIDTQTGEVGSYIDFTKGVSNVVWCQLGQNDLLNPYDMNKYVFDSHFSNTFKWLSRFNELTNDSYKSVSYDSHEFMQCIMKYNDVFGELQVNVDYTFSDGSINTLTKQQTSYQNGSGNISFDISPLSLGIKDIEQTANRTIKDYQVYLTWNDGDGNSHDNNKGFISEKLNFYIDRHCKPSDNIQCVWLNTLGGWDSIEFKTTLSEKLVSKSETNEFILNPANTFDVNNSNNISHKVNAVTHKNGFNSYLMNTGILDIKMTKYLQTLISSSEVYLYDRELKSYYMVIIEDYSIDQNISKGTTSLTVSFKHSKGNTY